MRWKTFLTFIFLYAIGLPSFVFAVSFTAFVPTNYKNPTEKRYDALRVEIPELADSQLHDVIQESPRTKRIVVYIPSTKSKNGLKASLEKVAQQIKTQPLTLEVRTYGTVQNPHLEKVANELEMRLGKKIKVGKTYDPKKAASWINRVSTINGAMGAGSRVGQIAYTGSTPDSAGYIGALGLIAYNGLIGYYGTKYEIWLGKKLSNHGLLKVPWVKGTRGFKALDNFYSNSESMRFFKGTIGNYLLWGLASNAVNQSLSHMNNRDNALPGLGDVGAWYTMSFISAPLYYLYFNGFQKAVQRGWLQNDFLEKYLRANDFVFQTTMVPNTSGNEHIQTFLGYLMGAYWGMQAVPALATNFLPIKNDRLVLVDSEISDRTAIKKLEGIDATLVPRTKRMKAIRAAFRETQALEPIRTLKEKIQCALGFKHISTE